jgi:hypothetical protein
MIDSIISIMFIVKNVKSYFENGPNNLIKINIGKLEDL